MEGKKKQFYSIVCYSTIGGFKGLMLSFLTMILALNQITVSHSVSQFLSLSPHTSTKHKARVCANTHIHSHTHIHTLYTHTKELKKKSALAKTGLR